MGARSASLEQNLQGPMSLGLRVSGAEYDEPVGKIYELKDGQLVKQTASRPSTGKAICREFESFEDYVEWRKAQGSGVLFTSGNFSGPDVDGQPVRYKSEVGDGEALALTKTFLQHRPCASILRVDIDTKRPGEVKGLYPEHLTVFATPEEVEEAIYAVLPELRGCCFLITDSSSAMIEADGKIIKGPSGYRVEIPVTDGTAIPSLIEHIHTASWLHGFGWSFVDGAGAIQVRSLADQALARPTQPDYAAPELGDCLSQHRRWLVRNGSVLNPVSVEPHSADAVQAAKEAQGKAANALARIAGETKAEARGRVVAKLVDKDMSKSRAEMVVDKLFEADVVYGDVEIVFDDGEAVRVDRLLIDGRAYDGRLCYDPVEPDYDGGRAVGKFYWNDGLRPGVHSFAHGARWYRFELDKKGLEDAVATVGQDDLMRIWAAADLSDLDNETVEGVIAKHLGLGNKRKALRAEKEKWRAQIATNAHATEAEDSSFTLGDPELDRLAKEYFVLVDGGKSRIGMFRSDHAFGGIKTLHLLAQEDFRLLHRNQFVPVGEKGMLFADWWMGWEGRTTYPNGADLFPHGNAPEGVLNLWQGWGVAPVAGAWNAIEEHLRDVVCDGDREHYDYLIRWLAYAVQHPEVQGEVCVVLRGPQGAGKTVISNLFSRIFGNHALQISQPNHLTGNFNSQLDGCCFLFADEAIFAGDPRTKGPLKALITDGTITIERKGVDAVQRKNRLSIMMATNEAWAVPVESGDRRYLVLDVSASRIGDGGYFRRLHDAVNGAEAGCFLFDLLDMDLSKFDLRKPPHTEARAEVMVHGFKGVVRFLYEFLDQGHLEGIRYTEEFVGKDRYQSPKGNPVTAQELKGKWVKRQREVSKQDFYEAYVSYCDRAKDNRQRLPVTIFWKEVKKCLVFTSGNAGKKSAAFEEFQRREKNYRGRYVRFKKLDATRKIFDQALGCGGGIWS